MSHDPPLSDEEQRRFEQLDRYVERLHAGDRAEDGASGQDLARWVQCLNALDSLSRIEEPHAQTADTMPPEGLTPLVGAGPAVEFGDYELLEELGRGGMGVVYRARQKSLNRIVALKMILASHLATPEQVARFHSEAQAAAAIRHPGVVGVHEVGQLHGQHYFTMEYVEGRTLAARLAEGPVPEDEAVRLAVAIARAVAHMHAHGIVHRDLKPGNILLDADGQPHVTDFGLAKIVRQESTVTTSGVIAGTPSYMPPEQAAGGSATITPAADVYGLGAILYELLTGRPPFREATAIDTLLAVMEREPPAPRELRRSIPTGLELICLKCLAKQPPQRYAGALEVAEELVRFAEGEPLVVQPPSLPARVWRWAHRSPELSVRIAALALFYTVHTTSFILQGATDTRFQLSVTAIVAVWSIGSFACRRRMRDLRYAGPARYAWVTLDMACLFAALWEGSGQISPMLMGLPILVAASALWMERRLIWYTTALAALVYVALFLHTPSVVPMSTLPTLPGPVWHVLFLVTLLLIAGVGTLQVGRIRQLSRFYQRQRAATS